MINNNENNNNEKNTGKCFDSYCLSAGSLLRLMLCQDFKLNIKNNQTLVYHLLSLFDSDYINHGNESSNPYYLGFLGKDAALIKNHQSIYNSFGTMVSKLVTCDSSLGYNGYIRIGKPELYDSFMLECQNYSLDFATKIKEFVDRFVKRDSKVRELFVKAVLALLEETMKTNNNAEAFTSLRVMETGTTINAKTLISNAISDGIEVDFYSFFAGIILFVLYPGIDNSIGAVAEKAFRKDKVALNNFLNYCDVRYKVKLIDKAIESYNPAPINSAAIPAKTKLDNSINQPFKRYLDKALEHNSKKKNVLNDNFCAFKDFYIPQNIEGISSLTDFDRLSVITGNGGLGKTMTLTSFFLDALEKAINDDSSIPIFIELNQYRSTNLMSLIENRLGFYDDNISLDIIKKYISEGRFIFFLDGVDEISINNIDNFIDDINSMASVKYNKCHYIITSRLTQAVYELENFKLYDLSPIDLETQIKIIKKATIDAELEARREQFIKALENNDFAYYKWEQLNLLSNPLLLMLTFKAYLDGYDIPTHKGDFFNNIYESMINRKNKKKPLGAATIFNSGLDEKAFKKYFALFCTLSYKDRKFTFTENELYDYVEKALEGSNVLASVFISDMKDKVCMIYLSDNQYYFLHRTFQEYFSFYYLSVCNDKDKFISHLYDIAKSNIEYYYEYFYDFIFERYKAESSDNRNTVLEKLADYVLLPYLEDLICVENAYENFLVTCFPVINYELSSIYERPISSETPTPNTMEYKLIIRLIMYLNSIEYNKGDTQDDDSHMSFAIFSRQLTKVNFAINLNKIDVAKLFQPSFLTSDNSIILDEDTFEDNSSMEYQEDTINLINNPITYKILCEDDFPTMVEFNYFCKAYNYLK